MTSSQAPNASLAALLQSAALAPLDNVGWIRVTGPDRLRWLNGMVTNSIQQLTPGAGCYNFVLNAQGQIQGDLTAFLLPDAILLQTSRDQLTKLLAHLDHFIIMDDVELAEVPEPRSGLLLVGPQSTALLTSLGLATQPHDSLHLEPTLWNAAPVDILHAHSPLVPRLELWADPATIQRLSAALVSAGAAQAPPESLEDLRLLEGTPRYGTDIRERDLPQETSQTRALHFTKGCYIGQEIVERIRSRGKVHRALSGFTLTGSLPALGTSLEADGNPVAELTSVASILLPGHTEPTQLALGIIRREALDRNLPLTYLGGTATPIPLPFAIL
jgi:aminomethyltransferase